MGRRFALGSRRFDIALSLLNITNRAALQEFLSRYTKDPDAVAALKRHLRRFEKRASAPIHKNSDNRIRSSFAVMFGRSGVGS